MVHCPILAAHKADSGSNSDKDIEFHRSGLFAPKSIFGHTRQLLQQSLSAGRGRSGLKCCPPACALASFLSDSASSFGFLG